MARPGFIDDPKTVDKLIEYMQLPIPRKDACMCAGVSYAAYIRAMGIANRDEDPRYVRFAERIKEARSRCVANIATQLLENGKSGDTTALIFLAKAMRPKLYMPASTHREKSEYVVPQGDAAKLVSALRATADGIEKAKANGAGKDPS